MEESKKEFEFKKEAPKPIRPLPEGTPEPTLYFLDQIQKIIEKSNPEPK